MSIFSKNKPEEVNVSASQQPQTEGLSKLMDILASCTAPLKVEASK